MKIKKHHILIIFWSHIHMNKLIFKYTPLFFLSMMLVLPSLAKANEHMCSGYAVDMRTNKKISGELKAIVSDLDGVITINFGSVKYTASNFEPEKPDGKYYPAGVTSEGNIIQKRAEGDYQFIQMSLKNIVHLHCK